MFADSKMDEDMDEGEESRYERRGRGAHEDLIMIVRDAHECIAFVSG